MKKYLLIFQHGPLADYSSVEGLEFALTLSAFEQSVSLLFIDNGILQLVSNKQTEQVQKKDYTKALTGLEMFDIKQVYVAQTAIQKYHIDLDTLVCAAQTVSNTEIAQLMTEYDIVLTV